MRVAGWQWWLSSQLAGSHALIAVGLQAREVASHTLRLIVFQLVNRKLIEGLIALLEEIGYFFSPFVDCTPLTVHLAPTCQCRRKLLAPH